MIYNQLSSEYNKLYIDNIREFQMKSLEIGYKSESLVDFYPSFGIKPNERTDLLVYGQATNGWDSTFQVEEDIDFDSKLEQSIAASNKFYAPKKLSPLDWVNIRWCKSIYNNEINTNEEKVFFPVEPYSACRSFFWQVTYKLVSDYYNLNRSSWDWSKKMVWSNLYKIAPQDANPNGEQINMQQELAIQLVKQEIEEVDPKFCIVITNDKWWQPFREELKTIQSEIPQGLDKIVSLEKYNNTTIIVTQRPRFGKSEEYVRQILEFIKS